MKKFFKNIWYHIYWFFKRLTSNGKKDFIIHKAFNGIQESKRNGNVTKMNIISSANKLFKPKKIIAFHKGKSIAKPKKSDHQVIETVKKTHASDLEQNRLKITKKGKFKHA